MSKTGWNQKPRVEESQQGMTVNGQGAGLAEKETRRNLTGLSLTRVTSTMAWPRDDVLCNYGRGSGWKELAAFARILSLWRAGPWPRTRVLGELGTLLCSVLVTFLTGLMSHPTRAT